MFFSVLWADNTNEPLPSSAAADLWLNSSNLAMGFAGAPLFSAPFIPRPGLSVYFLGKRPAAAKFCLLFMQNPDQRRFPALSLDLLTPSIHISHCYN